MPVLSSDDLRSVLTGDASNQTVNRQVFALLREMVRRRLASGAMVTCIDTTALTRRERRAWIRMAELHDCEIECVFFDVPLEECLRRNSLRPRQVPEEALRAMAGRLKRPEEREGFGRVTVVAPDAKVAGPKATAGQG